MMPQIASSQAINIGSPPAKPAPKQPSAYRPATPKKPVSSTPSKPSLQKTPTQIRWYGENTVNLILSSSEVGRHSFYLKPNIFNSIELPVGIHAATIELPRVKYQGNDFLLIDNSIFLVEFWVADDGKTLLFQTFTSDEYKQHLRTIAQEERNNFVNKNITPLVRNISLSSISTINFQTIENISGKIQEMADNNLVNAEEKLAMSNYFSAIRTLLVVYNELVLAKSYKTFYDNSANFGYIEKVQNQINYLRKSNEILKQEWLENLWENEIEFNVLSGIKSEMDRLPKSQTEFAAVVSKRKIALQNEQLENQKKAEAQAEYERKRAEEIRLAEQARLQEIERIAALERAEVEAKNARTREFYRHSGTFLGLNLGATGIGLVGGELGKMYADERIGVIGFINFTDSVKHYGMTQMGIKAAFYLMEGLYATAQFSGGMYSHYEGQNWIWNGNNWVFSNDLTRKPMAGIGFGMLYAENKIYGGVSWDFMSNFNGIQDMKKSTLFKFSLGFRIGY